MNTKIRPVFYLFLILLFFSITWLVLFQPQSVTEIHTYIKNKILQQKPNATINTTTTITTTTTTMSTTTTQENDVFSSNDYKQIVNYTNFEFLHLAECRKDGRSPILLIAVHTAPGNVAHRQAIRETWGAERASQMKVVFMMAIPQKTEDKQIVDGEHEKYKDIVQGNFIDSYKNLTYKHVMVLKYVVYHCPYIRFLLKTDDDVFVNMPLLVNYLNEINYPNENVAKPRELLMCSPMIGSPAIREESKWKVTFEEFAEEFYPPYCSGFAELMTPDTVFRIYHAAQKSRFLWVDDAFVTGIAREAANIKISPISNMVQISYQEVETLFKINNIFPNIPYKFVFGPINLSPFDIRRLWYIVLHKKIE